MSGDSPHKGSVSAVWIAAARLRVGGEDRNR